MAAAFRRNRKLVQAASNGLPKTLVLNADYSPISITTAIRSIMLCRASKAIALEQSGHELRSENETIQAPSVIVLAQYVKMFTAAAPKRVRLTPSRSEVMRRDDGTCQYCGSVATTIDHVRPVSKGGASTWDNLVAACWPCNNKKGSMLLSDPRLDMSLRCHPRQPSPRENVGPRLASYQHTWRKYLMPDA